MYEALSKIDVVLKKVEKAIAMPKWAFRRDEFIIKGHCRLPGHRPNTTLRLS